MRCDPHPRCHPEHNMDTRDSNHRRPRTANAGGSPSNVEVLPAQKYDVQYPELRREEGVTRSTTNVQGDVRRNDRSCRAYAPECGEREYPVPRGRVGWRYSPWLRVMAVLLMAVTLLPGATLALVSIPPSLVSGPAGDEVLFTVTHDPMKEPDPVTLPCRADGIPPPQYAWLKDDEPWEPSDGVSVADGEGTITFLDPRPEDEGVYQCVANNTAGVLYTDKAILKRSVLGYFSSQDARVVTANLGEPLTLTCAPPQGYPAPSTTWLLQTQDGGLRNLENSRITIDDSGTLRFAYVIEEDATADALYACAASSATSARDVYVVRDADGDLTLSDVNPAYDVTRDEDEDVTSITIPTEYRMGNWVYLNVSVPHDGAELADAPPSLQYTGPDKVLALEGDNLQLYCIYSGIPTPTVRWTLQGPAGEVELPSTESVLRISPVTRGDEGVYVCHPHNTAGEGGTHQFTVDVQAAPVFEEGPEMVSLPMEETARFTCRGRGDPTPAIQWTRDGVPIPGGETLEFDSLTTQDKSVIACNISNIHGYSYTTAFLNVLSMPPEFEESPQDSLVLEGDSVTLKCDAYGSPDPVIAWFKLPDDDDEDDDGAEEDDGTKGDVEELQDGELYEIKDDNLYIKSVTDITTGRYRCTATNKYGQVTAEADVHSRTPSSVKLTSESEAVKAGDEARLTCDVTHDPLLDVDVTWSKDNEELDVDGDDRISVSEDVVDDGELKVVLSIEASHGSDSGVYTCKAETSIDDHEDNTIIMVEDVPAPPTLVSLDCEEDSALLQWSSGGENNAPILSFTVQYDTDVAPGEWKEAVDELGSDRTTAQVEVRPGREYRFRVVAVNRVGESPPGAPLNCSTPPAPPAINPTNVTLVDAGATSLVLNWQPLTEEERQGPMFQYEILWREIGEDEEHLYDDLDGDAVVDGDDGLDEGVPEDEEDEWEKKVITNGDESVARVTGLLPNTRYVVKLLSVNALGLSSDGVPTRTEMTAPAAPIAAPFPLRVGEVKQNSAVVLWTPLDNKRLRGELKGYHLKVYSRAADSDSDEDDEEENDVYVDGDVTRATLTDLSPYTEYFVKIRADNTEFDGVYGEPVYFWTRQAKSSPVLDLKSKPVSPTSILVMWEPPASPNGKVTSYHITYAPAEDGEDEEGVEGEEEVAETELDDVEIEASTDPAVELTEHAEAVTVVVAAPVHEVKLADLEEGVRYKIVVEPKNAAGLGYKRFITAAGEAVAPSVPVAPVFTWAFDQDDKDVDGDGDDEDDDDVVDKDDDGDIDEDDVRNRYVVIGDTDGDGDVDRDDVLDTDGDGDIDESDVAVADIDNDGDVDEDDVTAADRDGDGDVDITDIGDEDGDGDFDASDVLAADEDGDGDIDAEDDDEEQTVLEDQDGDGDIDIHDVVDVDGDGDVDDADIAAADIDNDGDVDADDVKAADRDGDGDVDAGDVIDVDGDGQIDSDDLDVRDRDGDGDIDRVDFALRQTFLGDTDQDGDVDEDDVLDVDGDGDIDEADRQVADIDNDGDVDEDDVEAADRDGDGDVDAQDIGDEDNDGDVDAKDVIAADEDQDGDIDAQDEDDENVLLEDTDGDGVLSTEDLADLDGDGDVDSDDLDVFDIDNDGDIDEDDLEVIDRDGDGDVDAKDVVDFDGDGKIDEDDLEVKDRDGDGDVDATDFALRNVFLADVNEDGVIDEEDVLDTDGDGDVDSDDISAADVDDDGDVDEDDVREADRDGDGDIDGDDVSDLDRDGIIDEGDVEVKDRDGDGDVDYDDYVNRRIILGDTDGDGDVDKDDVLDIDGDSDVDLDDFKVADINNDDRVDEKDVRAGDRDGDGDVDFADIGDEDNDGDVDADDVEAADEDGDGDIDAEDDDGDEMILYDADGDGDIDRNDVRDVDKDGDVDDKDFQISDVNNDGKVNKKDVQAADKDGDGDIDSADIVDFDGDGDVDGNDLQASDRDGDGDVDRQDIANRYVILKDVNRDGKIDRKDVLDTDGDGDVDEADVSVADIDNDGDVDLDDLQAADRDADGDVDHRDVKDIDDDGDVDGADVVAADRDGDGDIDAADEGQGIDVKINWRPDFEDHPGREFFVQYRPVGTRKWRKSPVEEKSLQQTLRGLDPYRAYEVQVVAKDGEFETPSDITKIGPFRQMEGTGDPTVGAVQEEDYNPFMATWFVIAIIVAVTMMLVICFSVWAYHHRMSRIAELRAKLYEGYQPPAAAGAAAAAAGDVEAAGADEEQPMTAQAQRQQMAAMMTRQETIQSVDSFASHDDDFAEYGDESMAIDLLNSVNLVTRPPRTPRRPHNSDKSNVQ